MLFFIKWYIFIALFVEISVDESFLLKTLSDIFLINSSCSLMDNGALSIVVGDQTTTMNEHRLNIERICNQHH
jgi:hypothetical protein